MPYKPKLLRQAEKDYEYWQKHNRSNAGKIDELMEALKTDPFKGIGKPEPLRHNLQGLWSRRISERDRILYEVVGDIA